MKKAELFKKYKSIFKPVLYIKNLFSVQIIKHGKNNIVSGLDAVLAKRTSIHINGNNNSVSFGEMTTLDHCRFIINGDDNHVEIGKRNYMLDCEFICEDSGNSISTGEHHIFITSLSLPQQKGKVYVWERTAFFRLILIFAPAIHMSYTVFKACQGAITHLMFR